MTKKHEDPLLFLSYAHEDEHLCEQLVKHLSGLQQQALIFTWYDRGIVAGTNWAEVIDEHLERAAIILLLISADFLASNYCYGIEMQHALERHNAGQAHVIPVFLRPADWESTPLRHLQGLPRSSKAVTEWANQDSAFREIVQDLRRILEQLDASVDSPLAYGQHNREVMLKRIKNIWITRVLEQSLYHELLVELRLEQRSDVLENPWRLLVQETDQPATLLPVGTSIAAVYEQAEKSLLLLGAPGAGKTTLLLSLARTLLEKAEKQ